MWSVIQHVDAKTSRGLALIFDKAAALIFAARYSELWQTQTYVHEMIDGTPTTEPAAVFAGGTLVKGLSRWES